MDASGALGLHEQDSPFGQAALHVSFVPSLWAALNNSDLGFCGLL